MNGGKVLYGQSITKGTKERSKTTGHTLDTTYKIYIIMWWGRLVLESEEIKISLDSQTSFRKGRDTMDNVYILNHLADKQQTTTNVHVVHKQDKNKLLLRIF